MSNAESTTPKVGETQLGGEHRQANRPSPAAPSKAGKARRTSARRRTKSQKPSRSNAQREAARAGTKQDLVIQMLRRQSGVSIDDIIAKTNWQPHSVRGFFSGVLRKKLKLPLVSDLGKDGVRRYHIAPSAASKA